jgi:hypothetical protein
MRNYIHLVILLLPSFRDPLILESIRSYVSLARSILNGIIKVT